MAKIIHTRPKRRTNLRKALNNAFKKVSKKMQKNRKISESQADTILTKRLASAAGIQPDTINKILSGQISMPPNSRLTGLARILGISLERFKEKKKN